jgi:hypothetical protein
MTHRTRAEQGSGKTLAVAEVEPPVGIPVAAKLVVYTAAWSFDSPTEPGDEPSAQIFCRIFVNGTEIESALGIKVEASADFLTASIEVMPGTIEFVALDRDSWAALGK